MNTKTILLLMGSIIAVCVTVAFAMDQQIYASVASMKDDIRQILKHLIERNP